MSSVVPEAEAGAGPDESGLHHEAGHPPVVPLPVVDQPAGALATVRRGLGQAPALRHALPRALATATIAAVGRLSIPVLVQQVLDRYVVGPARGEPRPTVGLWLPGLLGVVAIAITATAQASTSRRLIAAAEASLADLRVRAFRHVHRLSLADLAEEQRGALVSRVTSDPEAITQLLSWGALAWVLDTVLMAVVAIAMLVYDWRLGLVALLSIAPLVVVLRVVQRRLVAAYDALRARVGDVLGALGETISGQHVIRSAGATAETAELVDRALHARRRADVKAGFIGALLFPCNEVFTVATTGAVLAVGVALGPARGLTAGTIVAFAFLISLFLQPVAELTEVLDQTQLAVAGWRRVLDLIDAPVAVPDPPADQAVELPPGPLPVEVVGASFAYPTGGTVLHDVSVAVPAGTRVALVGATGSGKSTLAKLVARLADPAAGVILVGGVDLRQVEPASLRRSVLVLPQEVVLFEGTVADNVRFADPAATDEAILAAFAALGLDDWVAGLPAGLATPVGGRGELLSVGERQLVALARAALVSPGVLVLDEATSALDPATEVRVGRALERLAEGRTAILVAHRLATAARADHVLVLEHGVLVESGTHADLVARGGPYAALYERWLQVASV